jgi:hypothetical protein
MLRHLIVVPSIVAALTAAALGAPAAGQSPGGAVPRTPWGHPDLQGRWTTATLTPLERPADLAGKEFFTPEEAAEYQKTALERLLAQINMTEEAAISGEFEPGIWAEDRSIVSTRARRSSSAPPAGFRRSRPRRRRGRVRAPPSGSSNWRTRPRNGRCPSGASGSRSAARRCCRASSTTATTRSCRRRRTSSS